MSPDYPRHVLTGTWRDHLAAWWHKSIRDQDRAGCSAVVRGSLRLASLGYGLGVRLRNWLYDRGLFKAVRVPRPVISVGNLTVGGTGKTPTVAWLARRIAEAGYRVAILSRNYCAAAANPCFIGQQNADASGTSRRLAACNDEARELQAELPEVLLRLGSDRVRLAWQALTDGAEVLVLDDGFQHRRLHRDLDIVLLDATNPWGAPTPRWALTGVDGYLLPRGLLREQPTALRRAEAVVLTRCDLVSDTRLTILQRQVSAIAPQAVIALARHAPRHLVNCDGMVAELGQLFGQKVLALCGVGNPEAFLATLRQLGAEIVGTCVCPDHCDYSALQAQLQSWVAAHPQARAVITTRKDLVKLPFPHLGNRPLWALVIGIAWLDGVQSLWQRIQRVLPQNQMPSLPGSSVELTPRWSSPIAATGHRDGWRSAS